MGLLHMIFLCRKQNLRFMKIIFGSLAHASRRQFWPILGTPNTSDIYSGPRGLVAGALAPARGEGKALPGWSLLDPVPRLPMHQEATDCAAAPEKWTS